MSPESFHWETRNSSCSIEEDIESNSMKKNKKNMSATKMQPITLDEVFQQRSSVTTPSIQVPLQQGDSIVLTPLSHQACMKHGINPEVLRNRSYESFMDDENSSEEIQHMRHGAYTKRRFEMMKLASEERRKLISTAREASEEQEKYQHQGVLSSPSPKASDNYNMCSPSCCSSSKSSVSHVDILRIEQRRLEKLRMRQKKELLMILQAEGKMGEIQRELKERAEREAQAEEARRVVRIDNAKRAAEDLRLRELRRKAAEDAEEEIKRIKAKEIYEREQSFMKEKDHQKKLSRKKAAIKAVEKFKQKEAHTLQMEQKQELERLKMDHLIEERRIKEKENKDNSKLKLEQDRAILAAQKKKVSEALKAKQEAAKQIEQKRMLDLEAKLSKMDKIHQAKVEKNQMNHERKQKEIEILSKKREQQLKTINDAKDSKKEGYMKKIQEHEETMATLLNEREQELNIVKEGHFLTNQLKLDNVERLKRSQEYKRQETLKKMTENEARAEEILLKKRVLVDERKRASREAKIQKDKIVSLLEQSKKSGGGQSIQKLLSAMESVSGRPGTEDDVDQSPTATPPTSSFQQSKKITKKEDHVMQQQGKKISFLSSTIGLEQRVFDLKKKIGSPPSMIISHQEFRHNFSRRGYEPRAYKSPYLASVFPKS